MKVLIIAMLIAISRIALAVENKCTNSIDPTLSGPYIIEMTWGGHVIMKNDTIGYKVHLAQSTKDKSLWGITGHTEGLVPFLRYIIRDAQNLGFGMIEIPMPLTLDYILRDKNDGK